MLLAAALIRKKETLTICKPLPDFVPRQLAIDVLHSHDEIIMLNPLAIGYKPIKAPLDASSDELSSTWYKITERVRYIPGAGKLGSSKASYNGCFHNMPWGLQTHLLAPMNVNLRIRYSIAGYQPNVEPPHPLELGLAELGAPTAGLYLREDIEFKCSLGLISVIKSQVKAASQDVLDRIITKATLLEAHVLLDMMEKPSISPQHTPAPAYQAIDKELLSPSIIAPDSSLNSPCDPETHKQLVAELPVDSAYLVTSQVVELPGDCIYPGQSSEP